MSYYANRIITTDEVTRLDAMLSDCYGLSFKNVKANEYGVASIEGISSSKHLTGYIGKGYKRFLKSVSHTTDGLYSFFVEHSDVVNGKYQQVPAGEHKWVDISKVYHSQDYFELGNFEKLYRLFDNGTYNPTDEQYKAELPDLTYVEELDIYVAGNGNHRLALHHMYGMRKMFSTVHPVTHANRTFVNELITYMNKE